MKDQKKRLAYWKGRLIDAKQAETGAREHYQLMMRCTAHAKRRVKQLERKVLVSVVVLVLAAVTGCRTVKGLAGDISECAGWIEKRIVIEDANNGGK
jgi:predicted small secreted protein